MPTVSSMVRQTDMIGQLSQNLFRLDMAAADNSILVGGSIKTNASFLQSDFGGQPALTNMVENYTEEKTAFRSELKDAMENLQKSSQQLQNSVQSEGESSQEVSSEESGETNSSSNLSTLQDSARNSVQSQDRNVFARAVANAERVQNRSLRTEDNFQRFAENYLRADKNDERETQADETENQDDRLTSVQNFVRDYNNAVSYLNDSRLSTPLSSLNQNDELTKSLSEIGISVNSSGALDVDENTLSEALQNDSEKITSALGREGLTGHLEKNFDRLDRQSENLFQNIVDYANRRETNRSESLYSAQNPRTAAYYGIHAGNLLNTFT